MTASSSSPNYFRSQAVAAKNGTILFRIASLVAAEDQLKELPATMLAQESVITGDENRPPCVLVTEVQDTSAVV